MWSGERYVVRGLSMTPAFLPGDQLFVVPVRQSNPGVARGDVAVVRDPREGRKRYLKRVIGLSGERVQQTEGSLSVNGKTFAEAYLSGLPSVVGLDEASWLLGDQEYFVLGDNRAHSTDSREFGPVGHDDIIGVARFRYWPLHRVGSVKRPKIEFHATA